MIGILLAAAVIPNFSAGRALQTLVRDDEIVQVCRQEHPRKLGSDTLKLTLLSRGPELVLVEMYDPCVCGAHNCPFWVYRVRGAEDERLLTSWGYRVRVVREAGDGVPDLVGTSQWNAGLSYETRYRYRNGAFAEVETWKLRGDQRKPANVPVHFAPGTSSAQLRGTIGIDWTDDYTVDAAKGQSLAITPVASKRATVVRLRGNGVNRTLTPGRPFILPVTGAYTIDVDLADYGDDREAAYAFTLSIR